MNPAVIFDMDGTLFQTDLILEPALEETFNQLREENLWDSETPLESYRSIMGVSLPEVWRTLLPNHTEEEREAANESFQKYLVEVIHRNKGALYPHTKDVLQALTEQSFSVFIASNGEEKYLHTIVQHFGLEKFIEDIYSIQSINGGNKGDLIRKLMIDHNISRGMVVGDRRSDIKAAKSNGLTAVGCKFDFSQEGELDGADLVIEDLSRVTDVASSHLLHVKKV
ncbi:MULTISPECIES: HAD hydrolase-like protein [Pontibacillus]|uniref:NIF family HAD-type phosphatase n=1 Tax=Pontibacillus chungwhensis TaxID=265426 RepID=A0ABY8UT01_9BACI|nr:MULTISPECIES: HAD hydrolase-like protein [Pontibacillus]MCD5323417.1 HAD hydrolase-like protein [Pontibacillus sp. HN14]WIF96797.1 NIF family HAD-type phosphatase [Pontibacillus chungwhensis]